MLKNCGDHTVSTLPGYPLSDHVDCFGGIFGKNRDTLAATDKLCQFVVGMPVTL